MSYQSLNVSDMCILKDLKRYVNLTLCKNIRVGEKKPIKYVAKCTKNEEKLENNIMRARSKLYELSICNEWEYFVTLTIDQKKYKRNDLEKYHRAFAQWIRNQNRIHNLNVKYLTVPELHADGQNWHEHGFILGIPEKCLKTYKMSDTVPQYIKDKLNKGEIVYDWTGYREKFGWSIVEPIRNHDAACKYMRKYITKDLSRSVSELGAHMYYASQGLERAKEVKRGILTKAPEKWDFENEYVKIKRIDKMASTAVADLIV